MSGVAQAPTAPGLRATLRAGGPSLLLVLAADPAARLPRQRRADRSGAGHPAHPRHQRHRLRAGRHRPARRVRPGGRPDRAARRPGAPHAGSPAAPRCWPALATMRHRCWSAVWAACTRARVVNEAGQSAILPVHPSLLADGYPPSGRARVLGLHARGGPGRGPARTGRRRVRSPPPRAVPRAGAPPSSCSGVPSVVLGLLCLLLREPPRGGAELAEPPAPVELRPPAGAGVGGRSGSSGCWPSRPTGPSSAAVAVLGLELVAVADLLLARAGPHLRPDHRPSAAWPCRSPSSARSRARSSAASSATGSPRARPGRPAAAVRRVHRRLRRAVPAGAAQPVAAALVRRRRRSPSWSSAPGPSPRTPSWLRWCPPGCGRCRSRCSASRCSSAAA